MAQLNKFDLSQLQDITGNFHPSCLIGQGGFGKVYRAMLNLRPVAIKRWDKEGLQGDAEFQTEKRIGTELTHPYIVRLLGYAEDDSHTGKKGGQSSGNACLVYELLSNGNLEEHLAPGRSLSWETRLRVVAQVSSALEFLHRQQTVHCDLKPSNVFLDCCMNSKLGDVGMAVRLETASGNPNASSMNANAGAAHEMLLKGAWEYLAPEYTKDGKNTLSTDVYSLGVILLQLVTGAHSDNDGGVGREVGLPGKGGIGLGGRNGDMPPRRDLRHLVQDCRTALAEGRLEELIDFKYGGTWDMAVAGRLVKLGLWCCHPEPMRRPTATVIAGELARLLEVVQRQIPVTPTA